MRRKLLHVPIRLGITIFLCCYFLGLNVLLAQNTTPNTPQQELEVTLGQPPRNLSSNETQRQNAAPYKRRIESRGACNRSTIVSDYNTNYTGSAITTSAALGWTGSVAGCNAGTISADAKTKVFQRINYFRNLAGLAAVTYDAQWDDEAQAAALMMTANNTLNHCVGSPDPCLGFTCYTAGGSLGARNSNLGLGSGTYNSGSTGSGAIDGYMDDFGPGNGVVGHRRWILYSRAGTFGYGSTNTANALWVQGATVAAPNPTPTIAFPPMGYIPRDLIPIDPYFQFISRWSFGIPGADFSAATVTMTDDTGASIPVTLETVVNGYGDNTLAWNIPNSYVTFSGAQDKAFQVTVSGVKIGGVTQSNYVYTTVAINPATDATLTLSPTNPTSGANGSITANFAPGAKSYLWSNGQTTQTITGLSGGTYTVTVTDKNDCQIIQSVTLTSPCTPPTINTQPSATTNICKDAPVTALSVSATVTSGTLTYQWQESTNGTTFSNISGETNMTYTPSSATAGIKYYRAVVSTTEEPACTINSNNAQFTVIALPTTANAGADQTSCDTGTFISGGNTPTTGTGAWSIVGSANGASITTATSPTSAVTGLTPGNSVVLRWTITNGTCTSIDDAILKVDAAATSAGAGTDQTQCDNTTFTLAGNTPTTGTGTWSVVSGTGTITTPSSPISTVTGVTAGTPLTLRWTITNATCTSIDDVILKNYANPTLTSVTPVNPTTCAATNGSIVIVATGTDLEYSINNGTTYQANATFSTLSAGSYTVLVRSGGVGGCVLAYGGNPVVLADPTAPTVNDIANIDVCSGNMVNQITFTGTAGATFDWTATNSTVIGLPTALGSNMIPAFTTTPRTDFSVTSEIIVTPKLNGCTGVGKRFVIVTYPLPIINATSTPSSNCVAPNGAIDITVSGVAIPPYTFAWSPSGATTEDISNLSAGTYTVVVTDSNTCQSTATATVSSSITLPAAPTFVQIIGGYCLGGTSGLNLIGQSGATYNWSVSGGTLEYVTTTTPYNNFTPTTVGSFTLSFSQTINGCTSPVATQTLVVNESVTISSVTTNNPTACAATDGSIVLNGLKPNTTYIIKYTKSAVTTTVNLASNGSGQVSILNLSAGAYVDITAELNYCIAWVASAILTDPSAPTVDAVAPQTVCAGETLAAITFTGTAGANFSWTNNRTVIGLGASGVGNIPSFVAVNSVADAQTTAILSVTPTLNNCVGESKVFMIHVNGLPNAPTSGGNQTICNGATIPALTATVGTYKTVDWYDAASGGTLLLAGNTSYTPTTAGTFYAEAKNTMSNCESSSRTPVTLTIRPALTATIGTATPICSGNSTTITITGTANAIVTYNDGSTNQTLTLDASGTGTINTGSLTADKTYTLVSVAYSDAPTCSTNITGQTATVTVNPLPDGSLAGNTICASGTGQLTFTSNAGTGPFTLIINGQTYSGIVSGTPFNATPNPTATTTYTLTSITDANTCVKTSTFTGATASITVNPAANAGIGSATTVCENKLVNAAVDLFGLLTGEQTGGTWTRTSGTGGTFNAASGIFTPAIGATTSVFTYTKTGTAPCIDDTEDVTININASPTVTPGVVADICQGTTTASLPYTATDSPVFYRIDFDATANTAGLTDIGLSVPATLAASPISITVPAAITASTYNGQIRVVDTDACESGLMPFSITVKSTPVITTSTATNPTSCGGTDGKITLNGLANSTSYSVSYIKDGAAPTTATLSSTASGMLEITALGIGVYTDVKVTLNACTSNAVTQTLVNPSTPATPTFNTVSATCENAAAQTITVNNAAVGATFSWSASGGTLGAGTTNTNTFTASAANTYSISVTQTVAGCDSPAGIVSVTVNAVPAIASSTKTDPTTCGGTDGKITLTGLANSTYSLSYIKDGAAPTISTISSNASGVLEITGLGIGAYTDIKVTANACTSNAVSQTLINPSMPVTPTFDAVSAMCAGATAQTITVNNAAAGATFSWSASGGTLGTSTTNTNTFTASTANTYTISVTQTVAGCASLAGTVMITVNPTPVITPVPVVCTSDAAVTLSATPTGGTFSGTGVTGNTFSAAGLTEGQTYTITNTLNSCPGTTNILVSCRPTVISPIGYCLGETAVPLTATSPVGATQRWYDVNNVFLGTTAPTPSTATAGQTKYYVSQVIGGIESAKSEITVNVSRCGSYEGQNSAFIAVLGNVSSSSTGGAPASIGDPCSCRNNAVANDLNSGQFDEIVYVVAPCGQTWIISENTGFYQPVASGRSTMLLPLTSTALASINTLDARPAALVAAGVTFDPLTECLYYLQGMHNDGVGFSVAVSNGSTTLRTTNFCQYPNPSIVGLPNTICVNDAPVTLSALPSGGTVVFAGDALTGFSAGPPPTFDPTGATRKITLTYTDANGCTQPISQTVNVVSNTVPTSTMVCNGKVNISVDNNCMYNASINPFIRNVNGTACNLNLNIHTFKNIDGYTIDVKNILGKTVQYEVIDINTNNKCWGEVMFEDKHAPVFSCSDITVSCKDFDVLAYSASEVVVFNNIKGQTAVDKDYIGDFLPLSKAPASYGSSYNGSNATPIGSNTRKDDEAYPSEPRIIGGDGNLNDDDFYDMAGISTLDATTQQYGLEYALNAINLNPVASTVMDCSPIRLSYQDEKIGTACSAGGLIVRRTWIAVDQWGNRATCTVNFSLSRPTVINFRVPAMVRLDCAATYEKDANGNPKPYQTVNNPYTSYNPATMTTALFDYDAATSGTQTSFYLGGAVDNTTNTELAHECGYSVSYTDQIIAGSCGANSKKILRTWIVMDWCNNTSIPAFGGNAVQIIEISDLSVPIIINCPMPNARMSTSAASCALTGALELPWVTDNCSKSVSISARVEKFLEGTSGNNFQTLDNNGNEIDFNKSPMEVLGRDRDPAFSAQIFIQNAKNQLIVENLPIGYYLVTYRVEDDCRNFNECKRLLKIEDKTPPVPVCQQQTKIGLTLTGEAIVAAQSFDSGSSDNCCLDLSWSKVARMDDATNTFAKTIKFSCADIGKTIMVRYQVSDCSGNTNECMVEAFVENKIPPQLACPGDVSISCKDAFGYSVSEQIFDITKTPVSLASGAPTPIFGGACSPKIDKVTYKDTGSPDGCGMNMITRRWTMYFTDAANKTQTVWCEQRIFVRGEKHLITSAVMRTDGQLRAYAPGIWNTNRTVIAAATTVNADQRSKFDIIFPVDTVDVQCTLTPRPNYGEVIINYTGCDTWAKTYTDLVLERAEGTCKKILRTHQVIDWCYFLGNGETFDPCNAMHYVDFGTINPNITGVNQLLALPAGCTASSSVNTLIGHYVYAKRAYDDVQIQNGSTLLGVWKHTQTIKLYDNNAPKIIYTRYQAEKSDMQFNYTCSDIDVCTYQADCSAGNITFFADATDACTPNNLIYRWTLRMNTGTTVTGTGSSFSNKNTEFATDGSFKFPLGKHKLQWIVEDGCGNTTSCEYFINIKECKKPTPVVLTSLSTTLMPTTAKVDLKASDFNNGSYDNCTIDSMKVVRCDAVWQKDKPTWEEGKSFITLTCDDFHNKLPVCVYFMVKDKNGNWDYVSTFVSVYNSMPTSLCSSESEPQRTEDFFSTTIFTRTEKGDAIETVTVKTQDMNQTTGVEGIAKLVLLKNKEHIITPEKNMNPLNGVSTFDLVLMSKHILGLQPFVSPYQLIAADVNQSGTISTLDMVEVRKMILGINNNFSNAPSWRFVDKAQILTLDNVLTTSLQESRKIVGNQDIPINFIGVKIGDVNGNAIPNSLLGSESRNLVNTLNFITDEQNISAGQDVKVHFVADKTAEGFQFTLNYDKNAIELLDIEGLNKDNYAILDKGTMTVSWNGNNGEKPYFTLIFKAKDSGLISKMLHLNSRITTAEAYTTEAQLMNIALNFGKTSMVSDRFELYQNQPNPFKAQTIIGFNLPESTTAQLTIFDATGRKIKEIKENYTKGYNQVIINDLNHVGLLYYQLSTDKHTATRKMIME